jgi:flagellar hook-associated protein 3 FlgL
MARISNLAQHNISLFTTLNTQSRVFKSQTEVSSGLKSQDFAGINRDAGRLVNIKNELERTEQFEENIGVTERRLELMGFSLERIEEVSRDFRTTLLNAKNGETADIIGLPALAQGLLDQVSDLMNIRDESRYLFAGGSIQTKPVQLDNGTYTPPTVPPFPAAANTDWYEGDAVIQQSRVDQDFVVTYGITADSNALEKVVRAFDAISEISFSSPPAAAEVQAIDDAVTLLTEALEDNPGGEKTVSELFGQVELNRKLVNDVSVKHENFIQFAVTSIADIEQVDLAEAVATLNFEMVGLEASFTALARVQQLSLSDFLR